MASQTLRVAAHTLRMNFHVQKSTFGSRTLITRGTFPTGNTLGRCFSSTPSQFRSQEAKKTTPELRSASGKPVHKPLILTPELIQKERNAKYVRLSWYALVALVTSSTGIYLFFMYERKKLEERQQELANVGAGKPKIGGSWSLVDHNGLPRTDKDFFGKYVLMYFGYTFCPDVCPEELEKISTALDKLKSQDKIGRETVVPLFVSCDPKRDSLEAIKEYLAEFHKDFLGLTGTHQQIKRIAKAFKMYYSAPPRAVDDDEVDYLVDHSIFTYLIGPDGKYVAHFGITDTADDMAEQIAKDIKSLKGVLRDDSDI